MLSAEDKKRFLDELDKLWLDAEQIFSKLGIGARYFPRAENKQTGVSLYWRASNQGEEPRFYVNQSGLYVHILKTEDKNYLWKLLPELFEQLKKERLHRDNEIVKSVKDMREIVSDLEKQI